ncbi:hypothetical protein JCM10450v2_000580 [Rhodotorula kratochvilovae]
MPRAIKRSSSSPPAPRAPPRPAHPQPRDADHDELDFLPSISPGPAPAPRAKQRSSHPQRAGTRPTSRDSPPRRVAQAGLHTPSASPQGGRTTLARVGTARRRSDGGSAARGSPRDERVGGGDHAAWEDEALPEARNGLRRGSRARRDAQEEEDVVVLDERDDDDSASPKKRRRSLTFKPALSQPEGDTERDRRARQRAEADRRSREQAPSQERRLSSSPAKERSPTKALRRRGVVLDDEEEDEAAAAPVTRVKPDPDAAPAVLVLDEPSASSASRARTRPAARPAAHTQPHPARDPALPSPSRAPPSPASASPRLPSSSSSSVPTVSTFLLSLPLPSLSRLPPLFHGLGLCTSSDLLQLASPAASAVRARGKVLERVDRMDRATREGEGGLTAWERIVLEEELEEVWRKWGTGEGEGEAQAVGA